MVFRKPYAFFIKYFRLINLILSILILCLVNKLNILHKVINGIYFNNITNYEVLRSKYIGFSMYFLLLLIVLLLGIILILLIKKKKPIYDYLYNGIYLIIIFVYLLSTSSLFLTLEKTIVEQTTLKTYKDISLLIIAPSIYFILKYILIIIGFNLKKFNFAQDIIELKKDEKDNEEIELIFGKNTYKYKRGVRKLIRELKYYFLENRFLISIIIGIIGIVLLTSLFSVNYFKSNKIKNNSEFVAGGFSYKVNRIYETKYNLNNSIIDSNYKFVIVNMNVKNTMYDAKSVDFKRIRLVYKNNYSYADNIYNKHFVDLGVAYDGEPLSNNTSNNYNFIFKIPISYKSNKYVLKFYDKVEYKDYEANSIYKEMNIKSASIDKTQTIYNYNLNENIIFSKSRYGESNITVSNYDIQSSYKYKDNGINKIIKDKDINKVLLIINYNMKLDKENEMLNYFNTNSEFFDKFITLTYNYNGNEINYYNVKCIADIDNTAFLSVPYEVLKSKSINLNFEFRDAKLIYKLK